jgi:membrane protein YqaA with SNARE-associated domain
MCAVGQCVACAVLYIFGEVIMKRWTGLAREVARVRERFQYHLERRFLLLTVPAGVLGVPPAVAMSVLGSGFGVPLRHLMPVFIVTRIVRFLVIIYVGDIFGTQFVHWIRTLV